MKTAKEIKDGMAQFYGTQTYRWFHPMVPNVLLTDGANYIAEECASYWLMNLIASYTPMIKDEFSVIELLKNGDEARVISEDTAEAFESVKTFDVLEAILSELDEVERKKIKEILEC